MSDIVIPASEIFSYQNTPVRIVVKNDLPWFCTKDVCAVLEIRNHNDAIIGLDDDEKSRVAIPDPHGRKQETGFITESGLYALMFKSRKDEAKRFRKWVTNEVLPKIRKNGSFSLDERTKLLENINQLQIESSSKTEELAKMNKAKIRAEKLHASILQKQHFFKFSKKGPCFYVITSGIDAIDGISRIKIGIAGCSKRKHSKCPHCDEDIDNTDETESIDARLASHRTLWPGLQVWFIVYSQNAKLLEQVMKLIYSDNINPNGHEIIENVDVRSVIQTAKSQLDEFCKFKEEPDYQLDDRLEEYNTIAAVSIKTNIPKIEYKIPNGQQSEIPIINIEPDNQLVISDKHMLGSSKDEVCEESSEEQLSTGSSKDEIKETGPQDKIAKKKKRSSKTKVVDASSSSQDQPATSSSKDEVNGSEPQDKIVKKKHSSKAKVADESSSLQEQTATGSSKDEVKETEPHDKIVKTKKRSSKAKALNESSESEDKPTEPVTKEQVVNALRELAKKLNRTPKTIEWDGPPSLAWIYKNFGSWNNALEEAKLTLNHTKPEKDHILEDIQALTKKLGRAPAAREWEGPPGITAVLKIYKKWNLALEAAGVVTNHDTQSSAEDGLDAIREYYEEHGQAPKIDEWRTSKRRPTAYSFIKNFGSWSKALTEAIGDKYEDDE